MMVVVVAVSPSLCVPGGAVAAAAAAAAAADSLDANGQRFSVQRFLLCYGRVAWRHCNRPRSLPIFSSPFLILRRTVAAATAADATRDRRYSQCGKAPNSKNGHSPSSHFTTSSDVPTTV